VAQGKHIDGGRCATAGRPAPRLPDSIARRWGLTRYRKEVAKFAYVHPHPGRRRRTRARGNQERTKAALAAAKARGKKLDGPRLAAARRASIKARSEAAEAFAANVRPIIKEIQASGVSSLRGVARALTARGVPTARGGSWSDVQVAAVLRR